MRRFDSQLGQSLEMLAAAHRVWQAGGRMSAEVLVDGQPIKDLCLTFVLPGGSSPCSSVHFCSMRCSHMMVHKLLYK